MNIRTNLCKDIKFEFPQEISLIGVLVRKMVGFVTLPKPYLVYGLHFVSDGYVSSWTDLTYIPMENCYMSLIAWTGKVEP